MALNANFSAIFKINKKIFHLLTYKSLKHQRNLDSWSVLPVYTQPPPGSYILALWLVLTRQPEQIWTET